ncbi:DUF397 domain-containing protein [Micromonospora craterilacus]|uniref:DUF397 domain-containing protein n=1 Tax=Micromonospora craterilacus TaxID=1655439 RepID=A0A2W2E5L9_9ACTN|nr:DUF397 domain-containing protein [Micromonospora craterilacus]PZG17621.1 DUF397 domain-containing protein [Micromonospora craterilacus]
MRDLVGAVWRTSSRSNDQGLCVEVADNLARVHGVVGIRDSKDQTGPVLVVSPPGWSAFVDAIQAGRFAR